MMQCDQFPLVGEDWRPGRSRLCVCPIMQEVGKDIDHLIVADRNLFGLPVRVLNDVDEFVDKHGSVLKVCHRQPSEFGH